MEIKINYTVSCKKKKKRKKKKKIVSNLFFYIKNCIYLYLGLLKGRRSYRKSVQPSKENIQHLKKWNWLTFFLQMWVIFALLDLDPDPSSDCESGSGDGSRDPNESGSRSGSTTLSTMQLMTGVTVWHPRFNLPSHRTPHLLLAAAPVGLAAGPPSRRNLNSRAVLSA
jgi:hypothetical protein